MSSLKGYLDYFSTLHPKDIDLDLKRIDNLLRNLGSPHYKLPPTIHVAGTNGKGSTLAFCKAICEAAGYKTHRYISPELVRFNERICLSGNDINDDELIELFKEIKQINNGAHLTQFEAITAAAFLAFSRHKADVLLLETGMGGEYDATNVIEKPLVTGISSISWDHKEFLGPSIKDITKAKAGIIKPRVPVVVGFQEYPEVLGVIEDKAAELEASLHLFGRDWDLSCLPDVELSLHGEFQRYNAALAVQMLQLQTGINISPEAVKYGLENASWPGRLQKVEYVPGADLWIDGAHNGGAIHAIFPTLMKWQEEGKNLTLIMAIKADKDALQILTSLKPLNAEFVFIDYLNENKIPFYRAEDLYNLGLNLGLTCRVASVFKEIVANPGQNQRFLVLGSLYFCGKILKNLL